MLHIKLYEDGNGGTEEVDTGLAAAFVLLRGMWQGNNSGKSTRSAEVKNLHRFFSDPKSLIARDAFCFLCVLLAMYFSHYIQYWNIMLNALTETHFF